MRGKCIRAVPWSFWARGLRFGAAGFGALPDLQAPDFARSSSSSAISRRAFAQGGGEGLDDASLRTRQPQPTKKKKRLDPRARQP